jgi:hypothetical protein
MSRKCVIVYLWPRAGGTKFDFKEGKTALILARENDQEEIVTLLKITRRTRITPAFDVLIPQTPGQGSLARHPH